MNIRVKTSKKGNELIDKYNEQGYISDDDFIELLIIRSDPDSDN